MSAPSKQVPIYHITHVNNLRSIINRNALWSDAKCRHQGLTLAQVGMSEIKDRRLNKLEVRCHQGTKVGEYVPFYFCSRSIMLYLLFRGNHSGLTYTGGQRAILHLQADLQAVVCWADKQGVNWAFSDRNAGTRYASFYNDLNDLGRIDWNAVNATDFRDSQVKEGKQAEFLMYQEFPWQLVEKIGTCDQMVANQVNQTLQNSTHRPVVSIERGWYY
ncbi:MAG: DUF4433 domain-containing protein [Gemmatimonadetes bacterium]|nr:DUF4433 domain-containing protein [Gemmatimonadota bacterium]MYB68704.1 DUF4433 domain-containing protein [Gemmatimonadota bacterium]